MAFEIEELFRITDENSDSGVSFIQGAGGITPTTEQDAADQGSVYHDRSGSGVYYKKTAGTGAGKWVMLLTAATDNREAGWTEILLDATAAVEKNTLVLTSKFEKQSGYIKHSGFIKGNA